MAVPVKEVHKDGKVYFVPVEKARVQVRTKTTEVLCSICHARRIEVTVGYARMIGFFPWRHDKVCNVCDGTSLHSR